MKVNYAEIQLPRILLSRNSLSGVADLAKRLRIREHGDQHRLSYWQLILLQSKVNGCLYRGDDLPPSKWAWPKYTWFQKRLSHQVINNSVCPGTRGRG